MSFERDLLSFQDNRTILILMIQKLFYVITLPFFLTGCIGSILSGQTEYMDEGFPDIRTVPEREEALAPRGLHQEEENVSRAADLRQLSQDWEQITARDKALREKLFPPSTASNPISNNVENMNQEGQENLHHNQNNYD